VKKIMIKALLLSFVFLLGLILESSYLYFDSMIKNRIEVVSSVVIGSDITV